MNDDLDKLAALLQEDVPAPSGKTKLAALEAGMAAFEESSENFQGSASPERLIHNRPKTERGFLEGLKDMFSNLSPRSLMLGGASFATIALAVVVTQKIDFGPAGIDIPIIWTSDEASQGGIEPADSELAIVPRPEPEVVLNLPLNSPTILATPELDVSQLVGNEINTRTETLDDADAQEQKNQAVASPSTEEAVTSADLGVVAAPPMQAMAPNPAAVSDGFAETRTNAAVGLVAESEGFFTETLRSRDQFAGEAVSPVKSVLDEPVSTFSIDVDTASYSVMRRSLLNGYLPAPASVRTEELINYFEYNYATPQTDEAPFAPQATLIPTPWNDDTLLLHIGIQGYDIPLSERPPVNLVFLLDTSGSMSSPDKLPLLIQSFRLLLGELTEQDSVAIVTYAGSAGMALEPTPANETRKILNSLMRLSAGGSTAGQAGLEQAYELAQDMMSDGETSRVILATDGDFNVGMSSVDAMKTYIEEKRDTGVYLSILGFGQGNYNDALMQTLAQNGNGTAAYIDTLAEAQKVLVDQIGGALFTIAQDVKIQIEFNPSEVAEYRLIGYETRALAREDFNNDAVDAGDIGAGTQVTALYEITPVGSAAITIDPLRYGEAEALPDSNGELAFLKLRYKLPGESSSNLITTPVLNAPVDQVMLDVIFSTAVASFGQLLRGDTRMGDWSFDDVLRLAQQGKGEDRFGYRSEFIRLVRLAETAQ